MSFFSIPRPPFDRKCARLPTHMHLVKIELLILKSQEVLNALFSVKRKFLKSKISLTRQECLLLSVTRKFLKSKISLTRPECLLFTYILYFNTLAFLKTRFSLKIGKQCEYIGKESIMGCEIYI